MRARAPIAAVALILAATGLAGCKSNVGTAATVDGHRISENTLRDYVRSSGPSAAVVAQAAQAGQKIEPKSLVLTYLVQREVFRRLLSDHGGIPNSATLQSYRGSALQILTNSADGSSLTDADLRTGLMRQGVDTSFVPVLLEANELDVALSKRPERAAIQKELQTLKVRVSARYGAWDAKSLQVNSSGGKPGYLTLQSAAASGAASQPAG